MIRTRVRRMRNNAEQWEWFLRDGDYADACRGFDSEAEARADLAREIEQYHTAEARAEDERAFWRVAFS